MTPRLVLFALLSLAVCSVHNAVAMDGELRLYKEPDFKRLQRILGVSTGNFCYDMPCADLNSMISSAKWSGLPTAAPMFADGQVKIGFYVGGNCTGKVVLVSTNTDQVTNFGKFGINNVTASFAVLETSTSIEHGSSNVCEW